MKGIEQEGYIPILVKCACGCGREFKPKYKWHKYFETTCRVKAWGKRQSKNAESEEMKKMKERIESLEQKILEK